MSINYKFAKIILITILISALPITILISKFGWDSQNIPLVNTCIANKIIPIHHWFTKNGIRVYFVPTNYGTIIDLQVAFYTENENTAKDKKIFNLRAINQIKKIKKSINILTKQIPPQNLTTSNIIITIVGNINDNLARTTSELIALNLTSKNQSSTVIERPAITTTLSINPDDVKITINPISATSYDKEYFDLLIGNMILGNNVYSRLVNNVQNIYNIDNKFINISKLGPVTITFYAKKELVEKIKQDVNTLLATFIANGPTEEEVNLFKQHLLGSFRMQFITNQAILNIVSYLGFYNIPISFFDNYLENLSLVTKESISRVWKNAVIVE